MNSDGFFLMEINAAVGSRRDESLSCVAWISYTEENEGPHSYHQREREIHLHKISSNSAGGGIEATLQQDYCSFKKTSALTFISLSFRLSFKNIHDAFTASLQTTATILRT